MNLPVRINDTINVYVEIIDDLIVHIDFLLLEVPNRHGHVSHLVIPREVERDFVIVLFLRGCSRFNLRGLPLSYSSVSIIGGPHRVGFLAAAFERPGRLGDFGGFEGFEGLDSGRDPKSMSQINGLVKGRIHGGWRRRNSGRSGEVSKVGWTRGEVEVLLIRGPSRGLLRFSLDRSLLQLLLQICRLVPSSSPFSSAPSSSSPFSLTALLLLVRLLLLLELGVLVILSFDHAELVGSLLVSLVAILSIVLPGHDHTITDFRKFDVLGGCLSGGYLDHHLHTGGSFG